MVHMNIHELDAFIHCMIYCMQAYMCDENKSIVCVDY